MIFVGSTMDLGIFAIALSLILYLVRRFKLRRVYELSEKIPGPKGLPFVGNLFDMTGGVNATLQRVAKESGFETNKNVMKMWAGSRLYVFISHPADVEIILSSKFHINKAPEENLFKSWLGSGILISSGSLWQAHRREMTVLFRPDVLKSFFGSINRGANGLVRKLNKTTLKEFNCHDYMSEAAVDILRETIMGVNEKDQENTHKYTKAVAEMSNLMKLRQNKLWLRPQPLFWMSPYGSLQKSLLSTIHSFTNKVVSDRKKAFETESGTQDPEPRQDSKTQQQKPSTLRQVGFEDDNVKGQMKTPALVDYLVERAQNGVVLTDEELRNQVDTVMWKGQNATAVSSSFFLCMMAAHPDVQEKVIEEIDKIFEGSDRDATFKDTVEMKYLERCIMETMRLYPPVPVIARELSEEVKLSSSDIIVPSNSTVVIDICKLHRRGDIYSNPTVFNPDNFLVQNSARRHYYSYIPFSAGTRSCIGGKFAMIKLKVLLSAVMRNFTIASGPKEKDWKIQEDALLKKVEGFKITVRPRKPTHA